MDDNDLLEYFRTAAAVNREVVLGEHSLALVDRLPPYYNCDRWRDSINMEDVYCNWNFAELFKFEGNFRFRDNLRAAFLISTTPERHRVEGFVLTSRPKASELPLYGEETRLYVEFLASAPWNIKAVNNIEPIGGVGQTLMQHMAGVLLEEDEFGYLGLNSAPAPATLAWYAKICMEEGSEPDGTEYHNQPYFYGNRQWIICFGRRLLDRGHMCPTCIPE